MSSNPDMSLAELKQRFRQAESNLGRIAQQSHDALTDDARQADTQRLHEEIAAFKTEMNDIRDDLRNIATKRAAEKVANSIDGVNKTTYCDTVKAITAQRDAAGIRTASPLQLQQQIANEVSRRREAAK